MTSREFCYWLQGFFELRNARPNQVIVEPLAPEQMLTIQNHLNLVFKHEIDPSYGGNQSELQAIHDGGNSHLTKPAKPGKPVMRC